MEAMKVLLFSSLFLNYFACGTVIMQTSTMTCPESKARADFVTETLCNPGGIYSCCGAGLRNLTVAGVSMTSLQEKFKQMRLELERGVGVLQACHGNTSLISKSTQSLVILSSYNFDEHLNKRECMNSLTAAMECPKCSPLKIPTCNSHCLHVLHSPQCLHTSGVLLAWKRALDAIRSAIRLVALECKNQMLDSYGQELFKWRDWGIWLDSFCNTNTDEHCFMGEYRNGLPLATPSYHMNPKPNDQSIRVFMNVVKELTPFWPQAANNPNSNNSPDAHLTASSSRSHSNNNNASSSSSYEEYEDDEEYDDDLDGEDSLESSGSGGYYHNNNRFQTDDEDLLGGGGGDELGSGVYPGGDGGDLEDDFSSSSTSVSISSNNNNIDIDNNQFSSGSKDKGRGEKVKTSSSASSLLRLGSHSILIMQTKHLLLALLFIRLTNTL